MINGQQLLACCLICMASLAMFYAKLVMISDLWNKYKYSVSVRGSLTPVGCLGLMFCVHFAIDLFTPPTTATTPAPADDRSIVGKAMTALAQQFGTLVGQAVSWMIACCCWPGPTPSCPTPSPLATASVTAGETINENWRRQLGVEEPLQPQSRRKQ